MAKKVWLLLPLVIALISLSVFTLKGFGKEQRLDNKGEIDVISEKLDEVLKNQQDIIGRLEDIREQQDIIRVRASHR
ncbi:MAG: hypothetical protein KKC66_06130 [Candidatus Omnitrophica bacterium]|nr:hypothetical protein [Candidatus Omnitrophota bacterium]MBU1933459.1 hypothetical protein [Candidatus Omnitrophota bacterium]